MATMKMPCTVGSGGGYTYPVGSELSIATGNGGTTINAPCEGLNTINLTPANTSASYTLDGVDENGTVTNLYTNTTGSKTNVDVSSYKILRFTRVGSSSASAVIMTMTVV